MNFWSNLSDFIFKITLEKVMLLVVFMLFWLVGYSLIPAEVSTYLLSKTPSFLPFGMTSVDIAILVFALLVSLIAFLLIQGVKKVCAWIRRPRPMSQEEAISIINQLNDYERGALWALSIGEFKYNDRYSSNYARNRAIIHHFLNLKLIRHNNFVIGSYTLDSTVKLLIMESIRNNNL